MVGTVDWNTIEEKVMSDFIDYCNRAADVSKKLQDTIYEKNKKYGITASDVSALAYFGQKEEMYKMEIPSLVRAFLAEKKEEREANTGKRVF